MSRVMEWRRFIELRLEDDGGAPVTAFRFAPVAGAASAALMRHRLLFRPRPGGFALFYRRNPEAAVPLLGEITARIRLGFAMRLTDPGFFDRHFPDFDVASGVGLHLDNLDGAGAVLGDGALLSAGPAVGLADAVTIVSDRSSLTLDLSGSSPTDIELRDPVSGALTLSVPVPQVAGASQASVVLELAGADTDLFDAQEVPPGPLSRRIFASDAATGAQGITEIYWEVPQDTVPDPAGVIYRAVFDRR